MSARGWITDAMNKEQSEKEKPIPELPSEPISLETEGVFDSAGYPMPTFNADEFLDNPMKMLTGMMGDLKDMALHRGPFAMPAMPQSEHKVRIFRFDDRAIPGMIAEEIELLLNDGYCCHMPTVVGDFVIMDFSRRKETEEDGQQS